MVQDCAARSSALTIRCGDGVGDKRKKLCEQEKCAKQSALARIWERGTAIAKKRGDTKFTQVEAL